MSELFNITYELDGLTVESQKIIRDCEPRIRELWVTAAGSTASLIWKVIIDGDRILARLFSFTDLESFIVEYGQLELERMSQEHFITRAHEYFLQYSK